MGGMCTSGILFSHKNVILPLVTTMGLEDIMLSEISQTEKDIPNDLTKKTKLKVTENRLEVARGGEVRVGKMSEGGSKGINFHL